MLNTDFFQRKKKTQDLQPSDPNNPIQMPGLEDSQQPEQSSNPQLDHSMIDPNHSSNHINDLIDGPLKSAVAMRLQNLLSEYPQPQQYEPSKTRKIFAGIAGGATGITQGGEAGTKLNREILDSPYQKALGDWNAKYKPTEQSYNLENQANKNTLEGYKAYIDAQHTANQDDPSLQGRLEAAKVGAGESAKEPYRIAGDTRTVGNQLKVENVRQAGENNRNELTVGASLQNNDSTVRGENSRNTSNITSRETIAREEIASRERIAARRAELQRELQKNQFHETRVPITDQVKARLDAESELLDGNTPLDSVPISPAELEAISTTVPNKDGTKSRIFKPEAEVAGNYKGALKIRKAQAAKRANDMLNEGFSNKPQDKKIDSEWELVP